MSEAIQERLCGFIISVFGWKSTFDVVIVKFHFVWANGCEDQALKVQE